MFTFEVAILYHCMKAADIRITGYIEGSIQEFENSLASFLMALLYGLVTIDLQVMVRMPPVVVLNHIP